MKIIEKNKRFDVGAIYVLKEDLSKSNVEETITLTKGTPILITDIKEHEIVFIDSDSEEWHIACNEKDDYLCSEKIVSENYLGELKNNKQKKFFDNTLRSISILCLIVFLISIIVLTAMYFFNLPAIIYNFSNSIWLSGVLSFSVGLACCFAPSKKEENTYEILFENEENISAVEKFLSERYLYNIKE